MAVSAQLVRELREKTGAGMMDCKRALEETAGSVDKAVDYLREKGLASAAKKASRGASEGIVDAYIHAQGRIGVLIEVNCETDFVARNEDFHQLVHDLSMQVAAAHPLYVRREDVPEDMIEHERQVLMAQAMAEGKPAAIVEKMVGGRLEKFFKENCLVEQPFIKDPDRSVSDVVSACVAKLGENIVVRRFVRYEMGEGLEKKTVDFAEEVRQQIGG